MTLNNNHLLSLLHDILDEQSVGCCGQVSEYQQIKRLVKNMMADNSISDHELRQILPEIYQYGRQGEGTSNIEGHITANQGNLETWMNTIQQINLE